MVLTRRTILGLASAGLVLIAASAGARSPVRVFERSDPYDIRLEDAAGLSLPSYFHQGRWFVLGEKGERYSIVISNPTSERVEAVVSVDGRDAISGKVASTRSGRGYIVPAHGSITVEGFRRSLGEVASFRFVDPASSYSARLGTPENVGVVGVAFFREKPRARPPQRAFREDASARDEYEPPPSPAKGSARPAPGASRAGSSEGDGHAPRGRELSQLRERASQQLGTEYGETRQSSVVEVPFERRSRTPETLMRLNYDNVAGLVGRGIAIDRYAEPRFAREPEAFPNSRFAEPPE